MISQKQQGHKSDYVIAFLLLYLFNTPILPKSPSSNESGYAASCREFLAAETHFGVRGHLSLCCRVSPHSCNVSTQTLKVWVDICRQIKPGMEVWIWCMILNPPPPGPDLPSPTLSPHFALPLLCSTLFLPSHHLVPPHGQGLPALMGLCPSTGAWEGFGFQACVPAPCVAAKHFMPFCSSQC